MTRHGPTNHWSSVHFLKFSFFLYFSKETIWTFWLVLGLILKGDCADLQTPLCSALYSLLLCPRNCGCFSLLGLSAASPQFREFAGLHHDSLSLHHGLETPEDSKLGDISGLLLFAISQGSCPLLAVVCGVLQTNVSCILFLCQLF